MPDMIEDVSIMNFDVSEEQKMFLEQVDRACNEIRPIEDQCYLDRRYNEQVLPVFKKAHLLGVPISRKYGEGQGADTLTYALALERIGQEGTGVRTFFSGHISLGQITLQKWGTEEQKERYLHATTRGDKIMAFGLTEPTAGSDPASLKTNFEEYGGYYLLNGSKAWISNGSVADLLITFAYPKGKTEGMCAFLVDSNSEGYSAQEQKHKMGLVSSDTGMIYFDNCKVPKENMLGSKGKGLSVAYYALMSGRLSVAAGCLGVMEDCLREMTNYSKERVQHKKLIGKHQLVQRHIGIVMTNIEAARLLVYKAAVLKTKFEMMPNDHNLRYEADLAIAKAKYFTTNVTFDAADRAVQVFGANGYSFESRVARHFCDARVCRIYEGTDEIMEQKIALQALGSEFEAFS